MEKLRFDTPKIPLNSSQYYPTVYKKRYIFLHHTVGGSAQGAINWWNTKPDHVATPFLIERDGRIIKAFDPKYWAYALNLKGGTDIEKASIHIELVSYGKLEKIGDKFYFVFGKSKTEIPNQDVVIFKNFYRESYYYHKYTDTQIESLRQLILWLIEEFKITIQPDLTNFWYYNKGLLPRLPPGIWSHSTLISYKSDIMPQQELIKMVYGLAEKEKG